MPALQVLSARHWRTILILLVLLGWQAMNAPFAAAQNATDSSINQSVFQMLYGVTNAQIGDNSPGGWLSQDANGDGINNGNELIAGTDPFHQNSKKVQVSAFAISGNNASLTFPTVTGKYYTVQGRASLQTGSWVTVSGVFLIGDGTNRTLTPLKSAGPYFRVVVQDNSSANDQVSDWAKAVLGYATGSSIGSQSNYNHTTLANALAAQNVVSVAATNPATTEPPDAITAASNPGVITFTRSGYQLFSTITVPITVSTTGTSGVDFVALPNSVTFAPGVRSVAVNVTPLYNASLKSSVTLTVTAQAGGGYSLGPVTATSATVTIYPPTVAGAAVGTGLTGQYYSGANTSYSNAQTLGNSSGATYSFTQSTANSGTIVITYTGAPAVPYSVGNQLFLTFTSGPLQTATSGPGNQNVASTEWNSLNGSSSSGSATPPTGLYTVTAVGTGTVTVAITTNGLSLPSSGNGSVTINPFAAPTNASNWGGIAATNYNYTKDTTTTGHAVITYAGTPSTAFAVNGNVTLQFTSGNLGSGTALGVYDKTYTITAIGSQTFTVGIAGTAVPSSGTGNATITPFTNALLTRLDPTVDFLWGTGQPSNATLQTATSNNWSARWDGYLKPPTTGSYLFQIQANDGARVYVNGTLVINAWTPGSSSYAPMVSSTVSLTQNVPVLLRVEYYHLNAATALVDLNWKPPGGGSFVDIPPANIFQASTGTGTTGYIGLYWSNIGAVSPTPASSAVNISVATPAVVTWAAHGLLPGTPVVFSTTGALPTGLIAGTTYYVSAAGMTTNSFEVSATPGGSVVNTSGTQSGTHTASTYTAFANMPRYGDYPASLSNLTWTSQPTATLPNGTNYSIAWDGYISPTETSTASMTIANPCVVTYTNHGLKAGAPVVFSTTGALPTGLVAGTTYYVCNNVNLGTNTFALSDTNAHALAGTNTITTTGSQSGTHTAVAGGTDTYTFDVQAADGARVYLDSNQDTTLETIIDAWAGQAPLGSPLASSTFTLTAGQQYKFRVEYKDGTSSAPLLQVRMKSNGTGAMAPIPVGCVLRADPLTGAATATTGLWATCFSNNALTAPALFSQQDPSTSNSSSSGLGSVTGAGTLTDTFSINPNSRVSGNVGTAGSNNYSGRFDTYLKGDGTHSGTYNFQLVAQSAGQVLINGVPMLTTFTAGTSTFSTTLNATQVVPLTVEFYDTTANGVATLNWQPPTVGSFSTIPAANFYLDAGGTTQGSTGSVIGTYYANSAMIGDPYFTDYKTQINSSFGSGQPSDSWGATTTFSATWDGYLAAATAGTYNFSLQAQSQARLYVNGTLVIDGWTTPGSAATTPLTGSISLPGGTNARVPIHVDYATSSAGAYIYLLWQSPNSASLINLANSSVFTGATTSQQGLIATYYANTTQTAPYFYKIAENNTNEVFYFFGTGRPDPTLPNTNLTVRWTGQVLPQYTEPYIFTVKSDDGARLWVNGQLVINKWQSQGTSEWASPAINLQAGVFYDIKLEYLNISGNSECHLNWYSPDQAEQIIPVGRLFPTSTGGVGAGPTGVTSTANDLYVAGSGTAYSYTIAGSGGPTSYSATGLSALGLSLNGNVISGTPSVGAGNYQFTVTSTNASGTSTQVVNLQIVAGAGNITREIYSLSGPNVSDLVAAIQSGTAPTSTNTTLTTTEDPGAYANNTGERLRGYITAPATGNYYFWIAGSGTPSDANHTAAELWISNSRESVAKVKRAYVAGSGTGSRIWNAQPLNQQSAWISLVGGQQYYFEILHNTGTTGASSNLSVGWFLDPTGNTANPIANGAGPAAASVGGIIPNYLLSPWDNPPTTTTSGTIYLASIAAPAALANSVPKINGSGGAYVTVNGSTGIVHLNYSGLTSGATSQRIYAAGVGNNPPTLLFDLGAQDKNYPNLKTSDGGYTWSMQGSDLTALQNGTAFMVVATTNYPITANNYYGELTGIFGKASGSQVAPALPSYPSWTDDHATNDASNSRFLTQATFGPSPSDMGFVPATFSTSVKNLGYSAWINNQFTLSGTHNVPYILSHLSGDPQNPYNDPLFFNSWWKNSITAPDQLRQRVAFALSEILVTSDVGPLNNNDRPLADYYDTLVDYAFTDFRTLLKQVSLTSAMGVYLNMQGNYKGSNITGLHANENYGREIMQLFSIGLYRRWPDGTLVLDSSGNPIPTYDQSVITGISQALSGWNYGQALSGGRLPTGGPSTNYLDPMVLLASQHELGTKRLLDNVVFPPAIVTSQSDTTHDPAPAAYQLSIQSTDPVLGAGNLVTSTITSTYDLYALHDFENALNSIMNNGAAGPYICRQLIQRLVTSNPKPEYVYRVVRAFNGERNVDGVSTGVVGDMKDVIRAILLDPEARSATAAANIGFGKQREPLLRVTGPARSFPPTGLAGAAYRELGGQTMLITTGTPHRLTNGDTVFLNNWVDSGSLTTNLPYPQGYSVANTTPSYNYVGSTHVATISAPGYKTGDTVNIQFTSSTLGSTSPYNTVQSYTVTSATTGVANTGSFTVTLGGSPPGSNAAGSAFTPYNFTVNKTGVSTPGYSYVAGTNNQTIKITSTGYTVNHQLYIVFTSGSLLGAGYDGVYTVQNDTATGNTTNDFYINLATSPGAGTLTSGSVMIPKLSGGYTVTTSGGNSTITLQTADNFDLAVNDQVWVDFLVTLTPFGAPSQVYTVTGVPGNNLINVAAPTVLTAGTESTNGMVAYPLNFNAGTRNGTVNVDYGTWSVGNTTTNSTLNQAPLNATTVFNFYYPDYQYPGAIAAAGMTTPEFQLTDASDTLNLTNAITNGILNAGNTFGYTSFFSGGGALVMDVGSYMTGAQTQNSAIPTLVSTLGTLLCGGNLTSASQTTISNYVLNNVNATISSIGTGSPCTVNTPTAHNLVTGTSVTISGVTGGTFPGLPINGTYTVTVTSPTQFTVTGVNCTSTSGISVANAIYTSSLMPNTVMRDRIRAILQLILTSAEYAIQK